MKTIQILAVVAIGALCLLMTGCTGSDQNAKAPQTGAGQGQTVQYTCPMHPEVVRDKPGDCPNCGMKLVEKH